MKAKTMLRRPTPAKRYSIEEVNRVTVLNSSQTDDLLYDDNDLRVWKSRVIDNLIAIEIYDGYTGCWNIIEEYIAEDIEMKTILDNFLDSKALK